MSLTAVGKKREAIEEYARAVLEFQSGTDYGQSGNSPADRPFPGIDADLQPTITRLVSDGYRGAIARREGDEARAMFMRESVAKLRYAVKRNELGITADELYSIGYRYYMSGFDNRPMW